MDQLNVVLTNFNIIRPKYEGFQEQGIDWLAAAHAQNEPSETREAFQERMRKLITRFGCSPQKIKNRSMELDDFFHQDWDKMKIYNLTKNKTGEGMEKRTQFYADTVEKIFERFYSEEKTPPHDLIHVTCTGYVSPSGAQKLVIKKGWGTATTVTHAYHMGCYGSMPAIRMAHGFLSSKNSSKRIDIVHTEMCTLHLNPSDHSPEQLVAQSLFSDGFIKYSAIKENDVAKSNGSGLKILTEHEELLPNSEEAMKWFCADWGMRIQLSKDVPQLISLHLADYMGRLFAQANLNYEKEAKNAIFAVHPGGPKIIDKVQELLELTDDQVIISRQILSDYGNMSSATLPHLWSRLIDNPNIPADTLVVSLGFGPGLTVCGSIMRKI
jgi:predicted naringenin-chalcone synthase